MKDNIKKFKSLEEYKSFKSNDEWDFPCIGFIKGGALKPSREFIMRWYDADTAKVPQFLGNITHNEFRHWVDTASMPCEIKKDGTDFNYLLLSDFNKTATDYTGLVEKGRSHYDAPTKEDYLQMTELKQVNIGLFQNTKEGWKEVHFNFDKGCPKGFHKWFAHPYWNESVDSFTKLWSRYDTTPITHVDNVEKEGINCCYGDNQGVLDKKNFTHSKGEWGSEILRIGNLHTLTEPALSKGMKILEVTYWEHLVLTYIFSAYYKTFNAQTIAKGLQNSMDKGFAGDWTNGQTDVLKTPHGKIVQSPNEPYRFMYMENPLYGKQYMWVSGLLTDSVNFKYWMTFDDILANEKSYIDKSTTNVFGSFTCYPNAWKYVKKIDLYGMPQEIYGTSTTGLYDAVATDPEEPLTVYVGSNSWTGAIAGPFSRLYTKYIPGWHFRGKLTMIR